MRGRIVLTFIISVVAVLTISVSVSAHRFSLTPSEKVPAATGEINTSADVNGNTKVQLKVQYLAEPGNLNPPATSYVVWFQEQDQAPENEGQLKVTGHLKGEFRTTTPWKNFNLFITAESDPETKVPSDQIVLHTKIES